MYLQFNNQVILMEHLYLSVFYVSSVKSVMIEACNKY